MKHHPTHGTISIDDMRLFAAVIQAGSFTAAAQALGIPKQTLSRRVAQLEAALGVRLLHRTTRRLHPSDTGATYAQRCAEIARLAEVANRAAADTQDAPQGTLRITADPTFGQAFLGDLILDYARQWPDVRLDIILTHRRVDLLQEGFDVAFRVGQVDDPALSGSKLGPARVHYCASPAYVDRHGVPASPEALSKHRCIVLSSEGAPVRWPFRGKKGPRAVPVVGSLHFTSMAMAHAATLAGLGIAIFPEFACKLDLRAGRLVSVLEDWLVDVGFVWLLHQAHRPLPAKVRAFVQLTREHFGSEPPWNPPATREPPPARRRLA